MTITQLLDQIKDKYDVSIEQPSVGVDSTSLTVTIRDNKNEHRVIYIYLLKKNDAWSIISIGFGGNEFPDNPDEIYELIIRALLEKQYVVKLTLTRKKQYIFTDKSGKELDVWQRINPESRKVPAAALEQFSPR